MRSLSHAFPTNIPILNDLPTTAAKRSQTDLAIHPARDRIGPGSYKLVIVVVVKNLLLIAVASIVFAASASADPVAERMAQCQLIEDASDKLACFEQVADDLANATPSDSVTAPAQVSGPAVSQTSAATATDSAPATETLAARPKPISRPKPEKVEESSRYEAVVKRSDYTVAGKLIVELTNGEIWQQTSRGGFRLPPEGSGVRVRKSFSGAWFLKFDHDGRESRMKLRRYGG